MLKAKYPLTGVAICVFKDNKILLGRRKKTPEMNSWQCPGGLLRPDESVQDCAHRLVKHKTGLHIHQLHSGPYTNNLFECDDFHSVTLYVSAHFLSGDIDGSTYSQAGDWQWFDLHKFPEPVFLPLRLLRENHDDWLMSLV